MQRFDVGEIVVEWECKQVKHAHLSVRPPEGRVTLVSPLGTRREVAHAFVATRMGWIRRQREQLRGQARQTKREYAERESHYLWGRRYLLRLEHADAKPQIRLGHRHIELIVRPGSSRDKRAEVMYEWHKTLLHEAIPPLIARWEKRLGVTVNRYFLQRMKTRWGSCSPERGHIRLNTELVKKPKDLLEYVIVHEMAHLLEPSHDARFIELLDRNYPQWRVARNELNALPLGWHE